MITLIGTIHPISIGKELYDIFSKIKPDFICIELDPKISIILPYLHTNKDSSLHAKDMLYAYEYSKKHNIPYELIDKPGTIEDYWKIKPKLTIKQRIHLFFLIIPYLIFPLFFKLKLIQDITKYIKEEKSNIYYSSNKPNKKFQELLEIRDKHMASNLIELSQKNKNIVALVGDAHLEGISNILEKEKIEFKTISAKDYIKLPITLKRIDGLGLIPNIAWMLMSFIIIAWIFLFLFNVLLEDNQLMSIIQLVSILIFWGLLLLYISFERIDKWREKKQFN